MIQSVWMMLEISIHLSLLSFFQNRALSVNIGLCDGDDLLDFPHHHDAC